MLDDAGSIAVVCARAVDLFRTSVASAVHCQRYALPIAQ